MQSNHRAPARRSRSAFALLTAAAVALMGCSGAERARGDEPAPSSDVATLRAAAQPLSASTTPTDGDPTRGELAAGLDPVLGWIDDAEVVLLGEASHGTEEFYRLRAELTERLIREGGLDAVVIEGDWPSAWRVDRYVRGLSDDPDARAALSDFARFPRWMWRNDVTVDFVEWLRRHNDSLPEGAPEVGFYGMDLYSPAESAARVLAGLDPERRRDASARFACFLGAHGDPVTYARALGSTSEGQACGAGLEQLADELAQRWRRAPAPARERAFDLARNARLVEASERYWRTQRLGDEPSWNVRDRHMMDSIEAIRAYLAAEAAAAARARSTGLVRLAVWAHNSHLGDARATEMSRRGELNVGQLVRERFGDRAFSVGFSTYTGEVTAVDDWGDATGRKRVRDGRDDSYEALLHRVGLPAFALRLSDPSVRAVLDQPRLSRAIGVIYRPETERLSHYFESRLPAQFDAVIHVDRTQALQPIDAAPAWQALG